MGFFDGNPAHLHPLPPEEAGKKYVEFMGGADAVLEKARQSFADGDYRWVAQVVNHVVFADPDNQAARELQADALEQLGYQTESGPWRNFYLSGTQELRDGVTVVPVASTASPDAIRATPAEMFFDLLAVQLNGPKAEGKQIALNVHFTDTEELFLLVVENGALNYSAGKQSNHADATLTMTRAPRDDVLLGAATLADK